MKNLFIIIILSVALFFSSSRVSAQHLDYRVMFYNAENYFDTFDDPNTLDNEFLPDGSYHWTWTKFEKKRDDLAKVIIALGEGKFPAMVGLCEIENRFVLNQLVYKSSLSRANYKIVHQDSPDMRGIDVALLYKPDIFKLIYSNFYEVSNIFKTREILYAKGLFAETDTLHVFVAHFPSKWGGAKESESRRTVAARELKRLCDSVLQANSLANILIMGDFNDIPNSLPIVQTLGAIDNFTDSIPTELYNLALPLAKKGLGTLKYRGVWEIIDLMFVSGNILNGNNTIHCRPEDFKIFKSDFLFEEDKIYTGKKPKRMYIGLKYNGGISDHLPVYLDLKVNKP